MTKFLKVVANPYCALDHEGVPCGAYPFDPEHGAGAMRNVGARIDTARTRVLVKGHEMPFKGRKYPLSGGGAQRTFWAYDLSPQDVPDCAHYRAGIRSGDIFPGDEATARAVGATWRLPAEALSEAREEAIATWRANSGEDPAFDLWGDLAPTTPDAEGVQ